MSDGPPAPAPAPNPPRPEPPGPPVPILGRARALADDPRAVLLLLAVVGAIAGVLWLRLGVPRGAAPPPAAPSRSGRATAVVATTARRPVVTVHVAGAVVTPGIVRLREGARVVDAISAAGGARPDADPDQLNLAARVADGERVLVPVRGVTIAATTGPGPASGARLHLNGATAEQLDALPGIGPTLAAAILRARDARGGFRSTADLGAVPGIGEARLAQLEPLVAP